MAYINTDHSVGDIVYAHNPLDDTVQRLRVTAINAYTGDATVYGAGKWSVLYRCVPAQSELTDLSAQEFDAESIHRRAEYAFPSIVEAAKPQVVTHEAVAA